MKSSKRSLKKLAPIKKSFHFILSFIYFHYLLFYSNFGVVFYHLFDLWNAKGPTFGNKMVPSGVDLLLLRVLQIRFLWLNMLRDIDPMVRIFNVEALLVHQANTISSR